MDYGWEVTKSNSYGTQLLSDCKGSGVQNDIASKSCHKLGLLDLFILFLGDIFSLILLSRHCCFAFMGERLPKQNFNPFAFLSTGGNSTELLSVCVS